MNLLTAAALFLSATTAAGAGSNAPNPPPPPPPLEALGEDANAAPMPADARGDVTDRSGRKSRALPKASPTPNDMQRGADDWLRAGTIGLVAGGGALALAAVSAGVLAVVATSGGLALMIASFPWLFLLVPAVALIAPGLATAGAIVATTLWPLVGAESGQADDIDARLVWGGAACGATLMVPLGLAAAMLVGPLASGIIVAPALLWAVVAACLMVPAAAAAGGFGGATLMQRYALTRARAKRAPLQGIQRLATEAQRF